MCRLKIKMFKHHKSQSLNSVISVGKAKGRHAKGHVLALCQISDNSLKTGKYPFKKNL